MWIQTPSVRKRATGYHCCDVQDGIFTFNVYEHHEKPWVEQMIVPLLVFFAIACVVSLFTLGQKGKLLVDKFRQRHAASSNADESVETLEEKLVATNMEIRKIYCVLLLGATEGAFVFTQPPLCSRMCQRLCCLACAFYDLCKVVACVSWCPSAVVGRLPLWCRSADVCTLALLPGSICRRVHPFCRCPSQTFE